MNVRLAIAGLLVSLAAPASSAAEKLVVAVAIAPQATFVERVGGKHVEVVTLIAAGQSPHSYEPTPRQMARLSKADLYISLGAPFEERLLKKAKAVARDLQVVDTRRGIKLRAMDNEHGDAPDDEHEHEAGESDPHVWLDPKNVRVIATNIRDALVERLPEAKDEFDRNLKAFTAELDRVDAKIARSLKPLKGRAFFVFHPSFGYFADAYGLRQEEIEVGGKTPSARQLAALIDRAKRDNVRVIFVQPQFPKHSASSIARAIDGVVAPLDPLSGDYLKNLEAIAIRIEQALAPTEATTR